MSEENSRGHISPVFAITPGISHIISSEPLRAAFSPRQGVPRPLSPRLLLGLGWLEARERVIAMPVLKENKTQMNFSGHRFWRKADRGAGFIWEEPVRRSWLEGLCWSPRLLEGLAAPAGERDGKHSIAEECFMENGNRLSVASCLCLVLAWGLSLLSPAIKAEPLLQQV